MQENLYQAPDAELAVEEQTQAQEFYVVSTGKFSILFLSTMGMYLLYWFYQNWANYKRYHEESLWPVPRAIFSVFFAHSLFYKVNAKLEIAGKAYKWEPGLLALFYILLSIGSTIAQQFSERGYGYPITDLITFIALPLELWLFVIVQKAVNFSQGDVKGESNASITPANILWIVLGLSLWGLALFGLFAVVE